MTTTRQSLNIIKKYVDAADAEILNFKNHRKWEPRPNTYRFTVDLISLEFLISLMEDQKVKNVYFNPSVPPPGGSIDSISLRYKIYVEYY
mgnify:CR=1 FL=1|tara:strand:+ start:63 stop:332 length:270 start_codon:yes stop_codon:yes gene_type:complete